MRWSIAGLYLLLLSGLSQADTYIRQTAVDIVRYEISLELTDHSDVIAATTKIHVRMRENGVSGMKLDFEGMQTDRVRVCGRATRFQHRDGILSFSFDRTYRRDEIAVVDVRYHGRPEHGLLIGRNRYGRRVFFSENWPDRARHWIPSIDHPYDKASVQITVTAPQKYSIVSNGRLVDARLLPNGRKRTRWEEKKAIPTYCIALGAAEFVIMPQKHAGAVPVEWYSYPEDSEFAARKFRATAGALEYFSSLIAPYPYEKLAQIQATVSFWGMENAGAIFYKESSIQDAPDTEEPVPHEIAHQWFGNSVTPGDWDHVWLSEGFATYMEALFEEHRYGARVLRRIMADYALRLNEDGDARLTPILDPDQPDILKKLNSVNYQKGAWVLHMLRGMMGDAVFFEGIRRYYRMHEEGNALSEDLQKALESAYGASLSTFFRQWLHQSGWPNYRVLWRWNSAAGMVELSIEQTQPDGLFDMPLDVEFVSGNRKEVRRLHIFEKVHTFQIPLKEIPLSIAVDPDGWVLKTLSITKH
jgi:aminopeptidase N